MYFCIFTVTYISHIEFSSFKTSNYVYFRCIHLNICLR